MAVRKESQDLSKPGESRDLCDEGVSFLPKGVLLDDRKSKHSGSFPVAWELSHNLKQGLS